LNKSASAEFSETGGLPNSFQTVPRDNVQSQLSPIDILSSLLRHQSGDWGDFCEDDRQQNEEALTEGLRLMSVYYTASRVKFWVITEWDRSVTTILMPEDY